MGEYQTACMGSGLPTYCSQGLQNLHLKPCCSASLVQATQAPLVQLVVTQRPAEGTLVAPWSMYSTALLAQCQQSYGPQGLASDSFFCYQFRVGQCQLGSGSCSLGFTITQSYKAKLYEDS